MDENHKTSLSYQISNRGSSSLYSDTAAFLFSVLIVSEIMCILMVLDYAFMGIFVFSDEENISEKKQELMHLSIESSNSFQFMPLQLRLNMKDVYILSQISIRKPGLGKVYRANYQERIVFLRKITFSRLSTYVLEEFSNELDKYSTDNSNILPIIGVVIDLPTISIISPFIEPGSLYRLLHISKIKLSLDQKLIYSQQIASGFTHIHYTGRVHGHLTSENVLINENDHVFISDLGMNKIKKYSGIVSGYTNKSAWSSPEIIKDKRLTPTKTEKSDDIYSFGMLLWEIFTDQIPFVGYDQNDLYQKIVVEGFRPELPKRFSPDLANIILECWDMLPDKRPSFDILLTKLRNLKIN